MLYGIAAIVGIVLLAIMLGLMYFYERVLIPSVCFIAAVLFIFFSIASEAYFMLIIPVFCVVYGVIYIKSNPIRKRIKENEKSCNLCKV